MAVLSKITDNLVKAEKAQVLEKIKKLQQALYMETSLNGLTFLNVLHGNIEVVTCIYAAFPVNSDKSPEVGVIAMLRDKVQGTVNIFH